MRRFLSEKLVCAGSPWAADPAATSATTWRKPLRNGRGCRRNDDLLWLYVNGRMNRGEILDWFVKEHTRSKFVGEIRHLDRKNIGKAGEEIAGPRLRTLRHETSFALPNPRILPYADTVSTTPSFRSRRR